MSAHKKFDLEGGSIEANLEWYSNGSKWKFICLLSSPKTREDYDGLTMVNVEPSDIQEAIEYLNYGGAGITATPADLKEMADWTVEHCKRHKPPSGAKESYYGM
jgi:hypothetical protein